jgi:hypothetical protein
MGLSRLMNQSRMKMALASGKEEEGDEGGKIRELVSDTSNSGKDSFPDPHFCPFSVQI